MMGEQIQELDFAEEKWKLHVAIVALLTNQFYSFYVG
jgi:hypothetical protein